MNVLSPTKTRPRPGAAPLSRRQRLGHIVTIYWRLLGVQLRSQLHYRVSFVMDVIAAGLVVGLEFGSLALVFDRFESLGGWTLGEVALLVGLLEVAFGLMDMLFSGFDPPTFGRFVRRGEFDQLLLRPINITVQVMGSALEVRRIGRIAFGLAIFGYAVSLLDVQWTAAKIAYLPFVVGGMVAFFGGLFIVGATITFWTIESIEIMNVLTYGGSFLVSHPMHIYQTGMRRFFTYVIPAAFLNYYPALYFLDRPDPFGLPAFAPFLGPFVGAGCLWLALGFWRFGRRHYQSTGT